MKIIKNKTNVFISYNQVGNLHPGWHGRKQLFVCANDVGSATETGRGSDDRARAGSVMHDISNQFYRGAVPIEQVKRYYVYAGLYAFDQALAMAKSLRTRSDAPVTVVACNCEKDKKLSILSGSGVDIVWSECGGRATMGMLALQAIDKKGE